jgi:hypothetical protein
MTIGLYGRRRNGKSLLMTILGIYFSMKKHVPLLSNDLKTVEKGYGELLTYKKLLEAKSSVLCLDEFWRDMDSWNWKDPRSRFITQWYQLQGHRDIILIYNTQLLSQINNRIRESTDYFIYCEKKKKKGKIEFIFTIFDGFTGRQIKKIRTNEDKVKEFYKVYDYIGSPSSIFNNEETNE